MDFYSLHLQLSVCLLLGILSFAARGIEVRIGHISGYDIGSVPKTAGAISLAIEKFQGENRLENYTFP